ncbi:hypothetical protein JTB14_001162 [Gonioctena quinquepunctata]|nr:hypothetical protein JTB14_001162 [Gonioctena quinquepunctata]
MWPARSQIKRVHQRRILSTMQRTTQNGDDEMHGLQDCLNIARKQERNRTRDAKAENTPSGNRVLIGIPREFLDMITNANLVNSEEEVVQID